MRQVVLFLFMLLGIANVSAQSSKTLIDNGWQFFLGDNPQAKDVDFKTSGWQSVDLPHDWSVALSFDREASAGNDGGYLPTGKGWYRKEMVLPKSSQGKQLRLYFEGVYMNAAVYVNGEYVGGHPYGYTSFFCDITKVARIGQRNVISVSVDNSQQKNCRWYSGSGIYRHVWLLSSNSVHIDDWGVYVTTPQVSAHDATIEVNTTICNETDVEKTVYVAVKMKGKTMASNAMTLPAKGKDNTLCRFTTTGLALWSPDSPALHELTVEVSDGQGKVVDSQRQPFGVRSFTYSATEGFRLNGKEIKLNGGCVHHDNGILGAAAFDDAEVRRVRLLKESGFNAVRTSHNPPSEAFLYACDSLGMLVVDEIFDGWRQQKNANDYHLLFDEWWECDLSAMLLRDRNHPSIFCWSTGNEVIERKQIEVVTTARKLASLCHRLDPSRPVTSALCAWDRDWEIYDPLAEQHDIVGYNYMIHKAESDHERCPERVMMQTESYPRDVIGNWRRMMSHPYIIGDFVWTAIDYLGESGIGRHYYEGDVEGEHYHRPMFPWHAAYCGDIDLVGHRKPISHLRSMLFHANGEQLYLAVREPNGYRGKIKETQWSTWPTTDSWTWPGWEGKDITVEVYSRLPLVRLYLNDVLVGEKKPQDCVASFTLPYQPGTLRAEAGRNGEESRVEATTCKTAGEAVGIRLVADKKTLRPNRQDLSFVTVEVIDADGNVCPNDSCQLDFSLSGNATIQAVGNADIKSLEPSVGNTYHAWQGRAIVVLRSGGKNGKSVLRVSSKGLKDAVLKL